MEEAKTTSKRLMDETKYLKTDMEQKHLKSVNFIDKLKKDIANKLCQAQGKKRAREEDSDDDPDLSLKFEGGLWKAQLRCEIRRKVIAGKDLIHLEALTIYDNGLFDAAFRPVPKGYKPISAEDLMKVDRAAWAEVSRLVRTKASSVEAALVHVAKSLP